MSEMRGCVAQQFFDATTQHIVFPAVPYCYILKVRAINSAPPKDESEEDSEGDSDDESMVDEEVADLTDD